MSLYVNDPDELTDITQYFEGEHQRINQIFNELLQDPRAAKWGNKVSLLRAAVGDLILAEEGFLYPKAKVYPETRRFVQKCEGRQQRIRELLSQMAVLSRNDTKWLDGVRELQSALTNYFNDEERELFPALRNLMSGAERIEMHAKIKSFHHQIRAAI